MLSQLLHPKILKKIQIRYSQWLPHNTPPMGTVAMNDHIDSDVDEVVLVFERNKAVVIDGNSLWTSLRLLNNIISIPSEQRSGRLKLFNSFFNYLLNIFIKTLVDFRS